MVGIKVTPTVHEKIIKEALSRIGIANKKERILYPSCYLTLIDGEYVVAHFKELFPLLTQGNDDSSDEDMLRRDSIITMLESWELITVEEDFEQCYKFVFVLKKIDRPEWNITHKINLKTLNQVEANNFKD
jgi:hypothetical protein